MILFVWCGLWESLHCDNAMHVYVIFGSRWFDFMSVLKDVWDMPINSEVFLCISSGMSGEPNCWWSSCEYFYNDKPFKDILLVQYFNIYMEALSQYTCGFSPVLCPEDECWELVLLYIRIWHHPTQTASL